MGRAARSTALSILVSARRNQMSSQRFPRIRTIFDALEEPVRERVSGMIRSSDGVGEDAPVVLDDSEAIRRRVERLDADAREVLFDFLCVDPALLDRMTAEGGAPEALADLGLVFTTVIDGVSAVMVPLEVRAALLDDQTVSSAPLPVLLAVRESWELEELAELHGVPLGDASDALDSALRIADALTSTETLTNLLDSLTPACVRLVQWLCEANAPVPREMVEARALSLAGYSHDGVGAAERVLVRLGLAHVIQVEGNELLTLPPDLRVASDPIIDGALSAESHAAYTVLRDDVVPTFRDIFPRGYGGSPLACARLRAASALVGVPDPENLLDRILATFRVIGVDGAPGEFASHLLDQRGPDAFARQCLRSWLASIDDDFTRALLVPFGCDTRIIADWLFSQPVLEAEPDPGEHEEALPPRPTDVWASFVYRFRAHIVLALGVLTAGHWFRVARFVQWTLAVFRRLLWHYSGFSTLGEGFPRHALPVDGIDLSPDVLPGLTESFVMVCMELLEPIGAVELDETQALFTVNPEALRVFRDSDPGFDFLWTEAESYLGEDVDLWLPAPTEIGPRIHGVAPMHWRADGSLVVDSDVHVHDLEELVRWACPVGDPGAPEFTFTAESIGRALDAGDDPEEFLVWLAMRSGSFPGAIRGLFPISASAADGEGLSAAAEAYAQRRIDALVSWSEHPPLELVESIRSWGPASVAELLRIAESCIEVGAWDRPELRHAIVLLGEIGHADATPLVLRTLVHAPIDALENAAGVAAIRIGLDTFDGLAAIAEQPTIDIDRRLTAAAALSALGALYPTTSPTVIALLQRQLDPEGDPEFSTLIALNIAETGHPIAESILYQLRDEGGWLEDVIPFDEALWIASVSPAVWGHPYFAVPLAFLFPAETESVRLQRQAGVEEIVQGSGAAALLHRAPATRENGDEGDD